MGQNALSDRRQRIFCRRFIAGTIIAIGLLLSLAYGSVANASPYGRGTFGGCNYAACPEAPPPTIITTPDKLRISINLTDNQEIPSTGYTILITPLNGEGQTFKEARIYIEGVLQQTVTPDPDGTGRWKWLPAELPGTHIKVEVEDTAGDVITENFTVKVVTPQQTDNSNPAGGSANTTNSAGDDMPQGNSPVAIAQRTYKHLENAVKALPAPVVNSFPYFLFILLGINVLVLLLQFQRELREYYTLRTTLSRARLLAEEKETFIALISHYLRTPLTVLTGGVELMKQSGALNTTIASLQTVSNRMRTKIEKLLSQISQVVSPEGPVIGASGNETVHFWKQPGLFLPLVLIAVVLGLFNMLAINAGKFSHSEVQVTAQTIVFSIMALTTYQIFRRINLRSRDRLALQSLVGQETQLAQNRDALMADTVRELNDDLLMAAKSKTALSDTPGSKYIAQSTDRLQTVLDQFTTAGKLQGIRSEQPPTQTTLAQLLTMAQANLEEKILAKHLSIILFNDTTFLIPDPDLLVRVLRSVLDNAIAFSPASENITVNSERTASGITITVHDLGPGIPADKIPLIFQAFYKAEGIQDFSHEGMGFSLYLDKLIMTYLGGDISITSEPGHGTTVQLTLNQTNGGTY